MDERQANDLTELLTDVLVVELRASWARAEAAGYTPQEIADQFAARSRTIREQLADLREVPPASAASE